MDFTTEKDAPRVRSLFDLAKRACIQRVDSLDDVGDLPYRLVRPILMKLQNPKILMVIEKNCPQIAEDDAELWHNFIRRDFGDDTLKVCKPKTPSGWHRIYRKLEKEKTKRDAEDAARLKETMEALKQKKEDRKTTVLGTLRPGEVSAVKRNALNAYRNWGGGGGGAGFASGSGGGGGGGVASRNRSDPLRPQSSGVFKSAALNKIMKKR